MFVSITSGKDTLFTVSTIWAVEMGYVFGTEQAGRPTGSATIITTDFNSEGRNEYEDQILGSDGSAACVD